MQLGLEGWLLPPFLLLGEIFTAVPWDKKLITAGGILGIHSAGNDKVCPAGKDIYIKGTATDYKAPTLESLCGCKGICLFFCLKPRESLNRTFFCGKEELCSCL